MDLEVYGSNSRLAAADPDQHRQLGGGAVGRVRHPRGSRSSPGCSGSSIRGLIELLDGAPASRAKLIGIEIPLPFGRCVLTGSLTMALLVLPRSSSPRRKPCGRSPKSLRESSAGPRRDEVADDPAPDPPAGLPGIRRDDPARCPGRSARTAPLSPDRGPRRSSGSSPRTSSGFAAIRTTRAGLLEAPFDKYTVLPIHRLFNWVRQFKPEFGNAAGRGDHRPAG